MLLNDLASHDPEMLAAFRTSLCVFTARDGRALSDFKE